MTSNNKGTSRKYKDRDQNPYKKWVITLTIPRRGVSAEDIKNFSPRVRCACWMQFLAEKDNHLFWKLFVEFFQEVSIQQVYALVQGWSERKMALNHFWASYEMPVKISTMGKNPKLGPFFYDPCMF